MIITPGAIGYGFLSLLALVLSTALVVIAAKRLAVAEAQVDRGSALVLALALGQAVLLLRLAAWPALYVMFGSYVGLIKGSMCLYGVTQALPVLTKLLELAEPLAFLVAGGTLAVLGAYRAGATVRARVVIAHLAVAAAVSWAASAAGIAFLAAPKARQEVSCCSAVTDNPAALSMIGLALPPAVERLVLPLTQSAALALLLVSLWQVAAPTPLKGRLLAPIALAHLAAAVIAAFGPLAPVLTGVPGHHCGYCLVYSKYVPHAAGLGGLALLGLATAVPIWLAWLELVIGGDESRRARAFRIAGILALIGFWTMVLVPYMRAR